MFRVTQLALLVLLASTMWSACDKPSRSFVEVPETRSPLLDGFTSYDSLAAVVPRLKASKWEVLEKSSLAPGDERPPFNIYSISIQSFRDLDQSGELVLEFFNDRLMKTVFLPDDYQAYVTALSNLGRPVSEDAPLDLPPFSRLSTGTYYTGQRYVSMEDVRLSEEMKVWIARYS